MKNRFEEMMTRLADANVDFIVAGGVACVLQGVERVTLDLDLSVSFAPDNLNVFLEVMKQLGMVPRAPVPPEYLADPDARREMIHGKHSVVFTFQHPDDPLWQMDIFLLDNLSYPALKDSCDPVDIKGRQIKVLSRQKLLEIKQAIQPPRPKDQMDIAELTRLIREENK